MGYQRRGNIRLMEKTYKVHIYAQAPGPQSRAIQENLMSFGLDSYVTNGLVLTYPGATSIDRVVHIINGGVSFISNTGKQVMTNLPVIIEEE